MRFGDFITAAGKLYKIVDVWAGDDTEEGKMLLENVESEKFRWIDASKVVNMTRVYP